MTLIQVYLELKTLHYKEENEGIMPWNSKKKEDICVPQNINTKIPIYINTRSWSCC